jgi:hypothetical protein
MIPFGAKDDDALSLSARSPSLSLTRNYCKIDQEKKCKKGNTTNDDDDNMRIETEEDNRPMTTPYYFSFKLVIHLM